MMILDVEQGSNEWHEAKLGVLSASHFKEIITEKTHEYSASAFQLIHSLIAEIITGQPSGNYQSDWMQRGIEMEAEAREVYEQLTGNEVEQVGLVYESSKKEVSCSPDGFTQSRTRGLEIKCPSPQVMIKYIIHDDLPPEYVPQVQGGMMVTNCEEWDFMAYHPDFKPIIKTIKRDDGYITKLRKCKIRFLMELHEALDKVQNHIAET